MKFRLELDEQQMDMVHVALCNTALYARKAVKAVMDDKHKQNRHPKEQLEGWMRYASRAEALAKKFRSTPPYDDTPLIVTGKNANKT